jgi:hypothetical protein
MFKDETHTQDIILQNANILSERLWDALVDKPSPAKTSMLATLMMCQEIGIGPSECIHIFTSLIGTMAHIPQDVVIPDYGYN